MLGLESLTGLRVVAEPSALDGARWHGAGSVTVVRIAPDEAFAIGASSVDIDDSDAIVEREPGFSGAGLDLAGLASVIAHVDFHLLTERPAIVQGKIAGVPAKLLLGDGDAPALLVVQTAYAADLEARLR